MRLVFAIGLLGALAVAACSSGDDAGSGQQAGTGGASAGGATGEGGSTAGSAGAQQQGGSSGEAGAAGSAQGGSAQGGAAGSSGGVYSGTWGLQLVMTSVVDAPVVGETKSISTTIARVDQTQTGDKLAIKFKVCDFDIASTNADMKIIVPDAFVNALPEETINATVTGGKLEAPKFWQVRSVKLADPINDALPTDKNDPRIEDWDKDGKPGLTLSVQSSMVSGDMYVIQRTWTVLSGDASGNDAFNGTISWGMEQKLLDSTSVLIKMLPDPVATTDPVENYFKFRRIDAVQGCADIVAMQDTLFK